MTERAYRVYYVVDVDGKDKTDAILKAATLRTQGDTFLRYSHIQEAVIAEVPLSEMEARLLNQHAAGEHEGRNLLHCPLCPWRQHDRWEFHEHGDTTGWHYHWHRTAFFRTDISKDRDGPGAVHRPS